MAKIIMVQGTASNVGKSVLVAALCRIFKQDGYKVAPFKSQNMALNSFITKDGFEIGRAQAMQAEACQIEPDVRMNPILLKPTGQNISQVIMNGKPIGNKTAKEYFEQKPDLKNFIKDVFYSLAKNYDIIVIEGAGSPAEINLKQNDIVNMGLAEVVNAPVLLVGDIDRGGVFASLYGTIKLLEENEQERVCGLIINKFRGDISILNSGIEIIEQLTQKPVIGVVPYQFFDIDDEDSLSNRLNLNDNSKQINISIIKLPHISNFTDFDIFSRFENVGISYVTNTNQLNNTDFIIIPGTKNTISDLKWLRSSGIEKEIIKHHDKGTPIFGICGGFQMMGQEIIDDCFAEYGEDIKGMGIFKTKTVFSKDKTTRQSIGKIQNISGIFKDLSGFCTKGYEIHMGQTTLLENANHFQVINCENDILDGCFEKNSYGTYMHGIFDDVELSLCILNAIARKKGTTININFKNLDEYKQNQYDKLADLVRKSLDIEKIYKIMEKFK